MTEPLRRCRLCGMTRHAYSECHFCNVWDLRTSRLTAPLGPRVEPVTPAGGFPTPGRHLTYS